MMLPLSLSLPHSPLEPLLELLQLRPTHLIFLQTMLLFILPDGVQLQVVEQLLPTLCCWLISHILTSHNATVFTTHLSLVEIKFVPEELQEKILAKETVVVLSLPQPTFLIPLMPKSSELFLSAQEIALLLEFLECTLMFPDMQMPSFNQLSHNLPQLQLHQFSLHL